MTNPTRSSALDMRRLRNLYRALGDESRLRIISVLADAGSASVNGLSTRIGLSQPLISWHLRILRLAGVIETQRNGREVICRLRRQAFDELHQAEALLMAGAAAGAAAERPATAERASGKPAEEPADVR